MMIEITRRQAETLARWARRAKEGKTTAFGPSFDNAMGVAELVRRKLEKIKQEEKEFGGPIPIPKEER